jgi:hypothetical protein
LTALQCFPFILLISGIASVVTSYLTKPENQQVLESFYTTVRPWGFWKPVLKSVLEKDPEFQRNTNFKRDMVNIAVGITWQLTMALIPLYFIIREYGAMLITIVILFITSVFLKFNWYDKLENE